MRRTELQTDTDRLQVERMQSGDHAAYEEIVRKYFGLVYSVALAHLKDREAAEDLAQEVFLRLLTNAASIRNPDYLCTWISRVTRNLATDWLRKRQRTSALVVMISSDEARRAMERQASEQTPASERGDTDLAEQLVMNMEPYDREIVMLRYVEEKPVHEIARLLGMHRSTVSRALARASRQMRRDFEQILCTGAKAFEPRASTIATTAALGLSLSALSAETRAAVAHAARLPEATLAAAEPGKTALASAALKAVLCSGAGKLAMAAGATAALAGGVMFLMSGVPASSPIANSALPASLSTTETQRLFRGAWIGKLAPVQSGRLSPLTLVYHFAQQADGQWAVTLDSAEGELSGYPLPAAKYENGILETDLQDSIGYTYPLPNGFRFSGTQPWPSLKTVKFTCRLAGMNRVKGYFIDQSTGQRRELELTRTENPPPASWPARKAIQLGEQQLERYVGRYSGGNANPVAVISRRDAHLRFQLRPQGAQLDLDLYPESDTTFFFTAWNATIIFGKNSAGVVDRVKMRGKYGTAVWRKVE